MKTTFFILVLMLSTLSCNSDDDTQQNSDPTLDGSWSLVNVTGGLAGIDDDFETGLIIWDFNQDNLELTVTNNNTVNVIYDGFPTGTYDYEIFTETNGEMSVVINTVSYRVTTLASSQLVIDEGIVADGFLLTFIR
ncbi:hypothetical protein DFQ10_101269 [Winogradskyella eximia]|uniref:Lipocalin-like protein n=1 Tax=Winogradskyella eximia TaxID=262006 RepID=A0A3D9HAI8_9FLAO|nr:hypothetical protein [Winogradskyella eximia]RED46498.1 hypothetical protein DFQ10_101269 [Winogradskyella eximia]